MSAVSRRAFAAMVAAAATGSALARPSAQRQGSEIRTPTPAPGSRASEVLSLRQFAESTSPRGLESAADPRWRNLCNQAQARANGVPDGQYIVDLRRMLAWFNEGHTTVVPFEFLGAVPAPLARGVWGMKLPLKARPFYDGLCVVEASGEATALLGARVRRICGVPIDDILSAHLQSWPGENPAWAHNWAGTLLNTPGLLHGLGFVTGLPGAPLQIDAMLPDGMAVSATITPRPSVDVPGVTVKRSTSLPERLRLGAHGSGNFVAPLVDRGAVYVSIDDMADVEQISFEKLSADLLALSRPDTIGRIVIDLRRNGGGDNYLGEPLRRELGRSRFNRPGGLYVLIGPATFSAAQNFANRLERETFATFVGEPTGSAPNLVGDAKFFVGEVTGLTAMVATKRWFDGGPDDKRRWIFPDLLVPMTYADWIAGRDRTLDAALSDLSTVKDDFGLRTRYFDRQSQQQHWQPYWMPS